MFPSVLPNALRVERVVRMIMGETLLKSRNKKLYAATAAAADNTPGSLGVIVVRSCTAAPRPHRLPLRSLLGSHQRTTRTCSAPVTVTIHVTVTTNSIACHLTLPLTYRCSQTRGLLGCRALQPLPAAL